MHQTRFFTLVFCSAAAFAQSLSPAAKIPRTLLYLTPEQIDPSRLLGPPPKDGSPAQQAEMAAVKHLIHSRTSERYAQATWDAQHEDATPFAETIRWLEILRNPAICSRNSHVSITLVSLSPSSLISSGRGMKPQWASGHWGTVGQRQYVT